ncbi:MAG: triphosphoribosyl-dephospho-CoA synthase [Planctomycetes bacterium]|nr:triphosphoribosyl-dephospho-CoA synthase [Planctomycetota bacterium]MBL7040230.1 triphosphoribosyl-dephospho-CoA synthase [Pirellulaceae bacterium]
MQNSQNDRPAPLGPLFSVGQCATLACLLEVTAPKPGNVHRGADFDDMTFMDFVVSATAIGPMMDAAVENGVGETVLEAVRATRQMVDVNANLGTVLLLAPLACVPRERSLESGVAEVLRALTPDDARKVYEAIRLAEPGGLGEVDTMDVTDDPPSDLLAAMRASAERDMVARQYAEDFQHVLRFAAPSLCRGTQAGWSLTETIIHTHLQLLAQFPDSLIARKCGPDTAREAANRAAAVLDTGEPGDEQYLQALGDLDFWLRSDGHRRNPGTTADLIAAGLFVVLRDRLIAPPFR